MAFFIVFVNYDNNLTKNLFELCGPYDPILVRRLPGDKSSYKIFKNTHQQSETDLQHRMTYKKEWLNNTKTSFRILDYPRHYILRF